MEQKKKEINIKDIFIKLLLKEGKKHISEKIFNNILINLKNKTKQKPKFILIKTIQNLSPKLKLISVPVGKRKTKKKNSRSRYFLMFLNEEKQIKISINWILSFSKTNKNFTQNIINEILETFNNKSKSIEKKKQMYTEIKKLKYNIRF
jgi:ribosomal protein S7